MMSFVSVPLPLSASSFSRHQNKCANPVKTAHALGRQHPSATATQPRERSVAPASEPFVDKTPDQSTAPLKTPFRRTIPYLGVLLDLFIFRRKPTYYTELYGQIWGTLFFSDLTLTVSNVGAIREILRDPETFTSGSAWPASFVKVFGDYFFSSLDGERHLRARKSAQKFFFHSITSRVTEFAAKSAAQMWTQAASDCDRDGEIVLDKYVKSHFAHVALFQTSGEALAKRAEEVAALFDDILAGLFVPFWTPVGRRQVESKTKLQVILREAIRETLATKKDEIAALREDLGTDTELTSKFNAAVLAGKLDLLTVICSMFELERDGHVDDDCVNVLADLTINIWFGSVTTMPAFTKSLVMCLGQLNTEELAQIRKEVDSVGDNVALSSSSLRSVYPRLYAAIEETARLYPPVPGTFRRAAKDVRVMGHECTKGTVIGCDIYGAQRDPVLYPSPNEYVVDRFLDKDVTQHVSFGAPGSVHQCMGSVVAKNAVLMTVRELLRHYEFSLDPNQDFDHETVPEVTPTSGVKINRLSSRM